MDNLNLSNLVCASFFFISSVFLICKNIKFRETLKKRGKKKTETRELHRSGWKLYLYFYSIIACVFMWGVFYAFQICNAETFDILEFTLNSQYLEKNNFAHSEGLSSFRALVLMSGVILLVVIPKTIEKYVDYKSLKMLDG